MKTGVIIQARMSSTRLPGKVLMQLPWGSGISVLGQVIRRLKRARSLDTVIVATTTGDEDDPIVEAAMSEGAEVFRGELDDVLSRYYHAAKEFGLDVVVRVTSDCPCVDPEVLDAVVWKREEEGADYASNTLQRTFPHGLDTEVFTFDALERAFSEAREPDEREHVTPYLYQSGNFNIAGMEAPAHLRRPDIRITLDVPEDYALLCAVYEFLYPASPFFDAQSIVSLFEDKKWLAHINEKVVQKKIPGSLKEEIQDAIKVLELQDLPRAGEFLRKRMDEL
jgi:spore coat polysaccharide biosynthesis protein SpsF